MNAFYEHHKDSIKFGYRCFDRILLNGLIQPFQQPERVIGFFNAYREGQRVTRKSLRDIAEQFGNWVKNRSQKWGAPILEGPEGIPSLQPAPSASRAGGFFDRSRSFALRAKMARLSDSIFHSSERHSAACQHRLFFSQAEYCDNLIFLRRAALDQLGERLLDANRTIGQPKKITVIFGRKITKQYRGKLQTVIEDIGLPNPVIRSHYGNGFIKQYVRDHLLLRTEPATNNVTDYGLKKAVENLPQLRQNWRPSATIISLSNRTSWKLFSTEANSACWLSLRYWPMANAFQV